MLCRIATALFALAYAAALAVLAIWTFGLFGQERDPLSGAYVILLGLPWTLWVPPLPDPWPLTAGVLAPAMNLALCAALCRWLRGRHHVP